MRIQMLKDAKGSPDGVNVHSYEEDEIYPTEGLAPMTDELARVFVEAELAIEVDEDNKPVEKQAKKSKKSEAPKEE
ncbi:MAG: hypothetical protein CGW95_01175 [Phenylobacterium zucineum]|nr:MAG: hypothetical protein CGW95_01175 [Phenylobacterium zucineum]